MGDIGVPELLIILAIVIVLFGANRLKGLGSALGSSIREFKTAVREAESPPIASRTDEVADSPAPPDARS